MTRLLELRRDRRLIDIRLAIAQNEMGIAHMMAGDYTLGTSLFEESIRTYRGLGDDYWECMESLAVVNLGQALWLLGRLDESEKVLDDGLAMRVRRYGEMDTHSFV